MSILLFCGIPLVLLMLVAIYAMMSVAASSDRQSEMIAQAMRERQKQEAEQA
jgi:hypothetical protein